MTTHTVRTTIQNTKTYYNGLFSFVFCICILVIKILMLKCLYFIKDEFMYLLVCAQGNDVIAIIAHIEVRSQLLGGSSFLLPHGLWESNSHLLSGKWLFLLHDLAGPDLLTTYKEFLEKSPFVAMITFTGISMDYLIMT